MESFFYIFLACIVDPVRWVICALAGWLVPNYAAALATGIGATIILSLILGVGSQSGQILVGAIASGIIVSLIYSWQRKSKNKSKAPASD